MHLYLNIIFVLLVDVFYKLKVESLSDVAITVYFRGVCSFLIVKFPV